MLGTFVVHTCLLSKFLFPLRPEPLGPIVRGRAHAGIMFMEILLTFLHTYLSTFKHTMCTVFQVTLALATRNLHVYSTWSPLTFYERIYESMKLIQRIS